MVGAVAALACAAPKLAATVKPQRALFLDNNARVTTLRRDQTQTLDELQARHQEAIAVCVRRELRREALFVWTENGMLSAGSLLPAELLAGLSDPTLLPEPSGD